MAPASPPDSLDLLVGSREFFPALIGAMDEAQAEIRLESYIFDFTASSQRVAEALERAALRGVQTMVHGRWRGQWRFARRMAAALRAGRCAVADLLAARAARGAGAQPLAQTAPQAVQCGPARGILWRHQHPRRFSRSNHGALAAPRFDFALRLTGVLVADIHQALCDVWQRADRRERLLQGTVQRSVKSLVQVSREMLTRSGRTTAATAATAPPVAVRARLLLRDNLLRRSAIERAYRRAISQAQHEVIIANAYFMPGRKLRQALVHAARRGVRVQLLLQGKYEYFMQYYASRPVYGVLLAAGVEIHEYSPSFLHAKVAVIDGQWATVGSSNLDPLSLLLAREANVMVQDQAFATVLRTRLLAAIAVEGQRMDPAEYAARPLRQRCFEWIAYGLMRAAP